MNREREALRIRVEDPAPALILTCLLIFLVLAFGAVSGQEDQIDSDSDGMPDDWELTYGLNETDPMDAGEDPDGDDLSNLEEYLNGTYPDDPDSDDDEMPDGWEVEFDLDPGIWSADNDEDGDGFTDLWEYKHQMDPRNASVPIVDDDADPNGSTEDGKDMASGSSSICFMVLFLAGGAIVFFMILGFYSKIRKDRLLDHETRQRIMDFIRENPGTYYTQIRKELNLAHGVVTHHINMLESQELVFSKQDRQFRRFYIDGLYKDAPMVTGTQKRVLDEIRRYPGSSQSEIAKHLDLYPMMVSYHVTQLEQLELVEKRKEGRKNLLFAVSRSGMEVKEEEGGPFMRGPFEGPAPEMGLVNE